MRCCLAGRVAGEEASASAADLLLVDLEGVAVLHVELYSVLADILSLSYPLQHARACSRETHVVRGVAGVDSGAVEEEAHARERLALTLAEGVHELLQLGGALDLEEDLVVVVGHLDVEVLGRLRSVVLVAGLGRGRRLVRHVAGSRG